MKATYKDEFLAIPENVTVDVKSRVLRVKGPRGTLTKDLHHLNMEIIKKDNGISFQVWHGKRKHVACLRTARALIANLIVGVTKGYEFRMRYVYAHFPINVVVNNGTVEIRNFLGEKIIRRVTLREGVSCEISTDLKDELILRGNSLENVSQTAADIQQSTAVKRKDIRKFLDGIYVSEKGAMKTNE